MIQDTIKEFPRIRLIFWCLFQRSMSNVSSYPYELQYKNIIKLFHKNVIDIEQYCSVGDFVNCVIDSGGHPNKEGYELLSKMITNSIKFDFLFD